MATFYADQISKRLRHRGVYEGREQSVSGSYRLAVGASLATTDLLHMLRLGENVRPIRLLVAIKKINGTPVLTNGSFSIGVAPDTAANVTRPDGSVYPPLVASTTVLGASTALGADLTTQVIDVPPPTANTEWGPYVVTLTPSGAGALSTAGGDVDIVLTAIFMGERTEAAPVYSEFSNPKFKNP